GAGHPRRRGGAGRRQRLRRMAAVRDGRGHFADAQARRTPMKVVILAGGYGTRISEESTVRPKPLVEIGGQPILWHIMKIYSAYGLNDFVICCGYKGSMIKTYFRDYALTRSDITFDLANHSMQELRNGVEP